MSYQSTAIRRAVGSAHDIICLRLSHSVQLPHAYIHIQAVVTITAIRRLVPNSTTRTPAMDMLYNTTNGHHQRTSSHNSTACCTTNLPHRNARARHLDMSRCWDVANFCPLVNRLRACCTTSITCCELVRSRCPCIELEIRSIVRGICPTASVTFSPY